MAKVVVLPDRGTGAALPPRRPGRRGVAELCWRSLDGLTVVLGEACVLEIRQRHADNPVLALVEAVDRLRQRYPLGSREYEDALKSCARARVAQHLSEHPELVSVRQVLFGRLYAGLLRRFEAERAHLTPRQAIQGILEYVRTFPLPGPDTLPGPAWSLLSARARLGMTQQALADRLGVRRRVYAAWESGRVPLAPAQAEWLLGELERLLRERASVAG